MEGKMAAMRAEMHSRRHDMSLKGQELDAMKAAYSDACKRQGRLVAEVRLGWGCGQRCILWDR